MRRCAHQALVVYVGPLSFLSPLDMQHVLIGKRVGLVYPETCLILEIADPDSASP
jgi:hypothetical protein